MGEIAYVGGKLVPLSEAKVSIFDRGFLYGDGLFETMRVYERVPFLLEKHLQRLQFSAEILRIPCPERSELESIVASVLEKNNIASGMLKTILTRGVGESGLAFSKEAQPTVVVTLTRGVPYTEQMYKQGFSAMLVPDTRSFGYLKSLNFLPNVMAKSLASSYGAYEGLFVRDGLVTEGTMSNIFAVRDGALITPPLDQTILPGITRQYVLGLAHDRGIDAEEAPLRVEEMLTAEEVFITNSVLEIMPVTRVGEKTIGNGCPGKICLALRVKYHELIKQHIAEEPRCRG